MNAKAYWQKLAKIGWLDYVPSGQHEELRQQIDKNLVGPDSAFAYLALAQGVFEARKTDCKAILRELARTSQGFFQPKKIKVVKAKNAFEVCFEHGVGRFSCLISADSESLSPDDHDNLLKAANDAVAKEGAKQRFAILPVADDFICMVFVPPPVYKAAEKAKLIPRAEVWSKGDEEMLYDLALDRLSRSFPEVYNPKMALKYAKDAVALDPEKARYKEALAAACAELGDFKAAVHWQELAVNGAPDDVKEAQERLKAYRKEEVYPFVE